MINTTQGLQDGRLNLVAGCGLPWMHPVNGTACELHADHPSDGRAHVLAAETYFARQPRKYEGRLDGGHSLPTHK